MPPINRKKSKYYWNKYNKRSNSLQRRVIKHSLNNSFLIFLFKQIAQSFLSHLLTDCRGKHKDWMSQNWYILFPSILVIALLSSILSVKIHKRICNKYSSRGKKNLYQDNSFFNHFENLGLFRPQLRLIFF